MPRLLVLLALASIALAQTTPGPIVDLGYAQYQGFFDSAANTTNFFGVRYAAPITPASRFRAPQAPPVVQGVQQANTLPQICLQASSGSGLTPPFGKNSNLAARQAAGQNEDCLFLNINIPGTFNPAQKLPVIVWIHGGGYVAGSPGTVADLVHDSVNQLIAVGIQYRLGLFGFLPGSEVKQNGDLNAGLLDQQFALQWVQQHISQFGGDPNKVTIWGESAGAGSVMQHILANGGNTHPPLFRGAITSSTFLPFQFNFNDPTAEALYAATVQRAGCANAADTLSCLRGLDITTLQATNVNISSIQFSGEFQYVPVVDGTFSRESPVAQMRARKVNGQALLSVTNAHEGDVFVSAAVTNGTLANYVGNAFPGLNSAQVQQITTIYQNVPGLTTVRAQASLAQGEAIFVCPTYFLLNAFGNRAFKGAFAVPPANHGDDVAYYFVSGGNRRTNNTVFINSFQKSFMNLAVFTDVNRKVASTDETPFWPLFGGAKTEMLFNVTADLQNPVIHTITTDPALVQRCNVWESLSGVLKQ